MEQIKTFEDACKKLGINPEEIKITLPKEMEAHAKALEAHSKLVVIAEALNDGWKPNWNDWDEYKYYPWFEMGSPSGSGFRFNDYDNWNTNSNVSSHLCKIFAL